MSFHAGFEVLILLLDLLKALIQLDIFLCLKRKKQQQKNNRMTEQSQYLLSPAITFICSDPHQFVYLHQLFLLLVELFVFDIQHHFEAFQLLLQIQGVRVFLQGQRNSAKMFT